MHVLLSGASGFLGSACVDLIRRFPEIELSVVRSSRAECVLPLGSREIFLIDPSDFSSLQKQIGMRRPTHIIHTAALSSSAACEQSPQSAWDSNVSFTETLVNLAISCDAHISFTSTDLVFDGMHAPVGGFTEADVPRPVSVYGRTKHEAELRVTSYERSCVVRLALLYGHSLSRSRGVLGWMEDTLHAREELPLFIDEARTPVHVADAARALLELSRRSESGTWHCGGPERLSRYDFGVAVAEALGYESSLIRAAHRRELPSHPARPEDVSLNSEKLWSSSDDPPKTVAKALAEE